MKLNSKPLFPLLKYTPLWSKMYLVLPIVIIHFAVPFGGYFYGMYKGAKEEREKENK